MNRRTFLVTGSAAGLVACTGPSASKSTAAPGDGLQLEAFSVDATTPFAEHGHPYLNALSESEVGRASEIVEWLVLPEYGRDGGATVRGAVVAVGEDREGLEGFFAHLPGAWQLPDTHELRFGRDAWGDGSGPARWGARVVRQAPVIQPGSVVGVEAHNDALTLLLDAAGASRLEAQSARNVGQRMAIIVDDEIVSDPVINQPISGGRVQITVRDGKREDYEALAQRFVG